MYMNILCDIKDVPNELCSIMVNMPKYNYAIYYYPLFVNIRDNDICLLEISRNDRDWKKFFKNGEILYYNDLYIDDGKTEDGPSPPKLYDIIIIDNKQMNVLYFEKEKENIKPNGVFIIENIEDDDVDNYQEILDNWRINIKSFSFRLFAIPNSNNKIDNRICIIQRLY